MRALLAESWRQHSQLLPNAGSLLGTSLISSALGLVYWAYAARVFSERAVGYGAAAVSAMTLLGSIGMAGLGTVLIGELPRRRERAELVAAALLTCALGSAVLGLAFAIVAPHFSDHFRVICGTPGRAALFTAGVALTSVALLFDQAAIGLMRGGLQLLRNTVFAVAKLPVLAAVVILLHAQLGIGIMFSWVVGLVVSLMWTAVRVRSTGSPVIIRPDWDILRSLRRITAAHYWLNLADEAQWSLIPVVVITVVSPSANAAFYVAWAISNVLYVFPFQTSTALFAAVSADPKVLARELRYTLLLSYVIGLPAIVVVALGAHLILGIFGAGYVHASTFPLLVLVIAYLPIVPMVYYIAVSRVTGRVVRAATLISVAAVVLPAAAVIGGMLGDLRGVSIALLAAFTLQGLATTPLVYRTAWGHARLGREDGAAPSRLRRLLARPRCLLLAQRSRGPTTATGRGRR